MDRILSDSSNQVQSAGDDPIPVDPSLGSGMEQVNSTGPVPSSSCSPSAKDDVQLPTPLLQQGSRMSGTTHSSTYHTQAAGQIPEASVGPQLQGVSTTNELSNTAALSPAVEPPMSPSSCTEVSSAPLIHSGLANGNVVVPLAPAKGKDKEHANVISRKDVIMEAQILWNNARHLTKCRLGQANG